MNIVQQCHLCGLALVFAFEHRLSKLHNHSLDNLFLSELFILQIWIPCIHAIHHDGGGTEG